MGEGVLYDTGINVIFVLYHFGEKHYLEKKRKKDGVETYKRVPTMFACKATGTLFQQNV